MLSQSQSQVSASTQAGTKSALLDRKIEEAAAGLPAYFAKQLHNMTEANAATIVKYIAAMKSEVNLSDNYRRDVIVVLSKFSKYEGNRDKPFKDLTRTDVLAFLDSFRKTETQDPLHKWIGT
jgi:integrase/recombinase XerD